MTHVVAIGAHPDDIEFGCGGALIKHRARGDSITLLIVSDGRLGGDPERRVDEQQRAAALLDANLILLGRADGEVGPGLPAELSALVDELAPDVVYTHRGDEVHQDHARTAEAVKAAARDVQALLLFESPRSAALTTGVFVDISGVIREKLALVACHKSQTSRGRFLTEDAIMARAVLHGIQAGVAHAELFQAARLTWDIDTQRRQRHRRG